MASDTPKRRRLDRVLAACDLCKRRKVKCDGNLPCSYCTRKKLAATCNFTAAHAPRLSRSAAHTPSTEVPDAIDDTMDQLRSQEYIAPAQTSPTISRDGHQEDTVVPLEGRILRDAQGKMIFIGDCAPVSFLQTVRHLITSEVDPEGVPTVRDSIIEIAHPGQMAQLHYPEVNDIDFFLDTYAVAMSGLVDLFHHPQLVEEMRAWATSLPAPSGEVQSHEAGTAVFYLVLALGAQESSEIKAEAWLSHARGILLEKMSSNMNVSTVQGFTLLALYMLRASQPNGAYMYFALAARAAYSIGLHRTEVNASFGHHIKLIRDRIWKSLRIVDILISSLLGRPTVTSDIDCTVKYATKETRNAQGVNILDASVQVFMIVERVVIEVYSRKRISIKIAEHVSKQFKTWASNWLQQLSSITARRTEVRREALVGACSTLCSYYYGIMLLTRPFLIYELYESMGASLKDGGTRADHANKRRYADAALDAAALLVDTVQIIMEERQMPRKMPLLVSWLFTAGLVLAIGVLGDSELSHEDNCQISIRLLDHFGEADPHARQYSVIVQSLLKTTTTHARKRAHELRLQRKKASSELFGIATSELAQRPRAVNRQTSQMNTNPPVAAAVTQTTDVAQTPFDWTIYDSDFFALPWPSENDQGLQDFLQPATHTVDGASIADIPLFPIFDQHYRQQ